MSPANNSTSKIQKIQQYFSEWDAECVVPYNPEFTANSKHRRTMFAPTSHSGKFLPPQNRSALCGFYVVLWDRKSGAEFFYSDTALILLLVCFSSIAFLHRFCRLAPIEALPQTPTGLCPVPTMGFTP